MWRAKAAAALGHMRPRPRQAATRGSCARRSTGTMRPPQRRQPIPSITIKYTSLLEALFLADIRSEPEGAGRTVGLCVREKKKPAH